MEARDLGDKFESPLSCGDIGDTKWRAGPQCDGSEVIADGLVISECVSNCAQELDNDI